MPVILFVSAFPQDGMAGWRVLVQKRSRYVRSAPDVWGLPGGRLNEAEERLSREGADGDVEARRMAAVREAFEECGGGTPRACRGLYLGGRAATPCSLPPGIADHADPGNTLTSISRDIMLYVLANRGWDAALFGDDGRLQWKPRALRRYKGEIDENDPGSVCGYAWIPVEMEFAFACAKLSSTADAMGAKPNVAAGRPYYAEAFRGSVHRRCCVGDTELRATMHHAALQNTLVDARSTRWRPPRVAALSRLTR